MGKNKLRKFNDLGNFPNVFEPAVDEVFDKDFKLKGNWSSRHFKNNHPIILELGCGKGEYTVGLANRFPEKNFVGIDIKGARLWVGAKQAVQGNITNASFIRTRIEFIKSFFTADEVDEIWVTFPDPQLKRRRNKKRLTSSRFLNSYREFLRDGGVVHLKTDNTVLYHYTFELVKQNELPIVYATEDLYGSDQAEIVFGITTYYEAQFISDGLNIQYLSFRLPRDKVIIEPKIRVEG